MSEGDGADGVVLAGGGEMSQVDRVAGSVNTSKHTHTHTQTQPWRLHTGARLRGGEFGTDGSKGGREEERRDDGRSGPTETERKKGEKRRKEEREPDEDALTSVWPPRGRRPG